MPVTADGEIVPGRGSGRASGSRTVRIGDELVTVPRRSEGQRRMLVWPSVERIYRSLCKRTGASFATDFAVLAMAYKDLGHVFGDRSVARARRREAERGTIGSKRVGANRKAGDRKTTNGTVRVWFPDITAEREGRWKDKVRARQRRQEKKRMEIAARKRERETARKVDRAPLTLTSPPSEEQLALSREARLRARGELAHLFDPPPRVLDDAPAPPPAPVDPSQLRLVEDERDRQLAMAAEWLKANPEPPPDKT